MISQLLFRFRRFSRQLWVRAALISAVAILAAASAPILAPLLPRDLFVKIEEQTVRSLLDILANSMLAVTTFSLTIMVTTHLTASRQITPRAHRVLREDGRTQTVLATFVGAFVFAVSGIVTLQIGLISDEGLPMLYIATLLVLAFVIVSILRWIDQLSSLGSMEETTRKVESNAREAIQLRMSSPFLGGRPLQKDDIPAGTTAIASAESGHVQHIDIGHLNEQIADGEGRIWICVMPGDWVGTGDDLALVSGIDPGDDLCGNLRGCFTIGDSRTFHQDAAFGASVLTEIAERALSPSTNDPKTAMDIISRHLRLVEEWTGEVQAREFDAPRVHVPPFDVNAWIEAAFHPIARDGAQFVEVCVLIQKVMARLARHKDPAVAKAAIDTARRALEEARRGLTLDADLVRVRAAAPDEVAKADPG